MLDFNEIIELEKRYEKYIKRQDSQYKITNLNQKQIIIILLSCILLTLVMFFVSNESSNNAKIQIQEAKQTVKTENVTDKNKTIESIKQKSEEAKNRYEDDKKQTELAEMIVKKIEEKNIILNEANTSISEQKLDIKQGWLTLNKIDTSSGYGINLDQNYETKPKQEIRNQAKLKIQIQNSKLDDKEKILQNNFAKTQNISYALELAKLYLTQEKYNEALKWSLQANEINSDNEDSWVLFAKAKYKLNQKDDAIKALKSYNKNKNSKTIDTLIKQIESNKL